MTPRWARGELGTRAGVLGCDAVEVGAKPGQVDTRSAPEHRDGSVGTHEPVAPQRGQLPDGNAMPGDDEGLTPVQSPHDLAAVVPELTLGDVSRHGDYRSTRCYGWGLVHGGPVQLPCARAKGWLSQGDRQAGDRGEAVLIVSPKVHSEDPGERGLAAAAERNRGAPGAEEGWGRVHRRWGAVEKGSG